MWDGPHAAGAYEGAYTGSGAFGQYITIFPQLDLVVAHKTRPDQREASERNVQVSLPQYFRVVDALVRAHCGIRC